MTVLIKLFYAGAVATLLVLFVAFGVRTFYSPPGAPESPNLPFGFRPAPIPPVPAGTPQSVPTPTPQELDFEAQQRRFPEDYERYQDRLADYKRNVFLMVSILAFVAVAAGLSLSSRLDAIRLGLVAGGLATILYGVIQAGGDIAKAGPAVGF